MIKALQKKFVVTAMTAITALIVLLLGAINAANIVIVQNGISRTIQMISESEGRPDNIPDAQGAQRFPNTDIRPRDEHDILLSSPFFLVRSDPSGEIVYINISRIASLDESSAKEMTRQVLNGEDKDGKIGKFRYFVRESPEAIGKSVVFLDTTDEIYSYLRVLLLSAGVGILCWISMLLLVILLSRKAIRPIAENMEKQKQFVTNAGHEIKTPLAIIQANTDAMELYQGESKWSKNIKQQTTRLDCLMKDLLLLARMDEGGLPSKAAQFSLSEMLRKSVKSFTEPMLLRQITIQSNIQPDIILKADQEQLIQLVSILMDNAYKYTDEGGIVTVSLQKSEKQILLQIENTCAQLQNIPLERLFDRFYRTDEARTQSAGGYGIGLSVARAIVESNKGSITAAYEPPARMMFTVIF